MFDIIDCEGAVKTHICGFKYHNRHTAVIIMSILNSLTLRFMLFNHARHKIIKILGDPGTHDCGFDYHKVYGRP